MRISRRTSGGRGEYEISENFGSYTPADLFDRRLSLDFGFGVVIDTGVSLRLQGGKRRLRRDPGTDIQLARQVAAVLLMPHPVRADEALSSGQPILKAEGYAIEHIAIDDVQLVGSERAVLRVGDLTLRNYDLHAEILGVQERMRNLVTLWQRSDELPPAISAHIQEHELHVRSGAPIDASLERIVTTIQQTVTEEADDLGIVYRQGSEDALDDLLKTLRSAQEPPPPPIGVDQVAPEETELRRRIVREWKRWVTVRGSKSARFRHDVRAAYNSTCVVCGVTFPATSFNRIAGVEGAHILPWAQYDLDVVSNGLCLCKQHHWAFDEGLIVVRHRPPDTYFIEIPDEARERIEREAPGFSVDSLARYAGDIPIERLPIDRSKWPNPAFLEKLAESEL